MYNDAPTLHELATSTILRCSSAGFSSAFTTVHLRCAYIMYASHRPHLIYATCVQAKGVKQPEERPMLELDWDMPLGMYTWDARFRIYVTRPAPPVADGLAQEEEAIEEATTAKGKSARLAPITPPSKHKKPRT